MPAVWTKNPTIDKPERGRSGKPPTITSDHWPIVYKDCVQNLICLLYKNFIFEWDTFNYITPHPTQTFRKLTIEVGCQNRLNL